MGLVEHLAEPVEGGGLELGPELFSVVFIDLWALDQNGAIPATRQPTRNPKITPELRKGSPAWGRSREVVIRARKPR